MRHIRNLCLLGTIPIPTSSSNITEVIRAVLNYFFLRKDFAHTKSTKSTKRHNDPRVKAQKRK